jgi:hypothetical protein
MALAACSGGGSGERLHSPPGEVPDVAAEGRWSSVIDWPLIPIHVALLPDGRVFSFGTDDGSAAGGAVPTGAFFYDIWNPSSREHLTLPNRTAVDTFCAAQLVLPQVDAGVLVVGGDTFPRPEDDPTDPAVPEPFVGGNADSVVLDYTLADPELKNDESKMGFGRWYGSVTTMLNGETYVQGGESRILASGTLFPEVRSVAGAYRVLPIDTSGLRYYYPRNFVAPDGRLFGYDTTGKMYYVDPFLGTITSAGNLPAANMGDDSTAAMFRPGRILNFGGDSDGAIVIDIRDGSPEVQTTADLSSLRRLATATILPNGHVLASGGSAVYNTLLGANLAAETWDPVTGQWTLLGESAVPRLYHSSALLLPDATVLIAGGGAPGPLDNLNAEIYSPPYLFTAGGKVASRPVINTAPATLVVGRQFDLTYTGGVPAARVVLVKTGAETHGINFEQRFIELAFAAGNGTPKPLTVSMPSRASDVPPGYYLLFVLNADGVPSRAKIVFINVAAETDPAQDPSVVQPADRAGSVGTPTSLTVHGSDPNAGTTLRYAAAGLPAGLGINPTTGAIGGTPTAAGDYDVVVSVSDGTRTASANFLWSIAP